MAEQETPRVLRAIRDLEAKAKEMADAERDPASEAKRLRGLIRAILSKGPYVFDARDEEIRDGRAIAIGRCFWCGAVVEGKNREATHVPTCAWLALETEGEQA